MIETLFTQTIDLGVGVGGGGGEVTIHAGAVIGSFV